MKRHAPLSFSPASRRLVAAAALAFSLGTPSLAAEEAAARRTVVAGSYKAGALHRCFLGPDTATPGGLRSVSRSSTSTRRPGGSSPSAASGASRPRASRSRGRRPQLHLPRSRKGRLAPSRRRRPGAEGLDRREDAQRPDGGPAPRERADRPRHPGRAAIPCPRWRLVVLPDDPALGEFQKDFAGAVGVFAEYPQAAKGAVPGFLGATEIIDHVELYERLEAGEGDAADTQALLRARLVDIFMGDWDRHRKQWRWAKLPGEPALDADPRGPRPGLLALRRVRARSGAGRDPRFQDFAAEVRQDRRPHLQRLGAGPAAAGGLLARGLRRRRRRPSRPSSPTRPSRRRSGRCPPSGTRSTGPGWSRPSRRAATRWPSSRRSTTTTWRPRVDVYLTNQSRARGGETARQRRHGGHRRLLGPDGTPGAPPSTASSTSGDRGGPLLRPGRERRGDGHGRREGSPGADDRRPGQRHPRRQRRRQGEALGLGGRQPGGGGPGRRQGLPPAPAAQERPLDPAPRLDPRDVSGRPGSSYGGDLGVFLGTGSRPRPTASARTPTANAHRFSAGWAFKQAERARGLHGRVPAGEPPLLLRPLRLPPGVEVLRFYGFGNETEAPARTRTFYKVEARQFVLYPSLKLPFAKQGLFTVGPAVKFTSNEQAEDQFVNTAKPYGVGEFGELALHGILSWDGGTAWSSPRQGSSPRRAAPTSRGRGRGERLSAGERQRQRLPVRRAPDPGPSRRRQEGVRDYPYMEARRPGSGRPRRGGAGGAPRHPARLSVPPLPGRLLGLRQRRPPAPHLAHQPDPARHLGHPGFADVGRVWLEGEESDTWHTGVGGGLWISFLRTAWPSPSV